MALPVGPYTPIVQVGDLLICSGQIGIDDNKQLVGDTLEAQLRQAFLNLSDTLAIKGATLADVVKMTVFLVSMDDFAAMNAIYLEAFGDKLPTRSAVAVAGLPLGARVELEAWARTPD